MEGIDFASAPLKIITSAKEYVDDERLDVDDMVAAMLVNTERTSTACPSEGDWMQAFGDAEHVFCVTITSGLSGSYNSARLAKRDYEEAHPGRKPM